MNRNRYIMMLLGCTVILGASSCKKDFLEITPKGRLIAETTEDYNLSLNDLDLLNQGVSSSFVMSDDISAVMPYFSATGIVAGRQFRWVAKIYEDDDVTAEMAVPMKNIYLYNTIINEVLDSKGSDENQKLALQAEAKAGRAWTNFQLINYYAKPYAEATAATDPGFPIITVSDVTATSFPRGTVAEMYAFIVQDLQEAIPHLPTALTHRLRMSQPAAEGLLGKVYLFMGKSDEAIPYLDNALNGLGNATISAALYDYNTSFEAGGAFYPISMFGPASPTAPNMTESLYAKQYSNNWTFIQNEFVMSEETRSLFDSEDKRLLFYATTPFMGTASYPAGMLRRMAPAAHQIGVTLPDLYLLRAEAKARVGDLAGAKADLEMLRRNRMPEADAMIDGIIAADQEAMIKYVIEERRREFALTGQRWFDMRRLSIDPIFAGQMYAHHIYDADGTVSETITLDPQRLVLQFPQRIVNENPGFVNNP